MSARETLRGLTVPAATVFVFLACLTGLLQVPRWLLALAAELAEVAVVAGTVALTHLAGRVVVITDDTRPYRRSTS